MSIRSKEGGNRAYRVNEAEPKQVRTQKDISKTTDHQLKFERHMYEKIMKASNKVGIIRRSFIHLDQDMFLKLCIALVGQNMEYAHSIW